MTEEIYSKIDDTIDYPTITDRNIDTWNEKTYSFIIQGMMKLNPDIEYGTLMRHAQNLTNTLFNALKNQKTPEDKTNAEKLEKITAITKLITVDRSDKLLTIESILKESDKI